MRRYDKSNGIIEIRHNEGIDKWLVVRKTLNEANKVRGERERENKRTRDRGENMRGGGNINFSSGPPSLLSQYKQEVSATELALAFPLPDDLHSLNYVRL